MRKERILIITEANRQVASGHLFECIVCREYLKQQGINADLMINEDMPNALKARIGDEYITYRSNIQNEVEFLINYLKERDYGQILFNLREIRDDFLLEIKEHIGTRIICIDEFGNRRLDADVIINPMIDESYWRYDTEAHLYCGAEFLVLPMELQKFHGLNKEIHTNVKKLTVSMGGADLGNSTLKLAQWLPSIDKDLEINLVLGGAYRQEDTLQGIIRGKKQFHVYKNISFLNALFYESDLAICAGGNTLHELAVIGTPAIVIPSMPHEIKNGKAFERKGFGFCGSIAHEFTYEELWELYIQMKKKDIRARMYSAGKKIADGRGYKRIYDILMND